MQWYHYVLINQFMHKYLHIILLPFLSVCSTLLPQSFQHMWKASVLSTICVVKIQAFKTGALDLVFCEPQFQLLYYLIGTNLQFVEHTLSFQFSS